MAWRRLDVHLLRSRERCWIGDKPGVERCGTPFVAKGVGLGLDHARDSSRIGVLSLAGFKSGALHSSSDVPRHRCPKHSNLGVIASPSKPSRPDLQLPRSYEVCHLLLLLDRAAWHSSRASSAACG